ncbi:hypothetical protein BURKHO8Y_370002 [Burkholderia sp. 8Y]|nr:hypothetical protein BURKHO8Y_370002 [Burkholderia sp. 8Y]
MGVMLITFFGCRWEGGAAVSAFAAAAAARHGRPNVGQVAVMSAGFGAAPSPALGLCARSAFRLRERPSSSERCFGRIGRALAGPQRGA